MSNVNIKCGGLFEGVNVSGATPNQLMSAKRLHDYITESVEIAKENQIPVDKVIDEGILSGLITGGISAAIGPAVAKSVCKCLGISEDGPLGKLLLSPLVMGSIGYTLGY